MTARNEAVLVVFAKTPVPGRVKTRLIPELGEAGAAELYKALLERTLRTAAGSEFKHIELHCTPSLDHPLLQSCRDEYNLSLHLQRGEDLGERMHRAISQVLFNNASAVLIGCDIPDLTAEDLNTAREKLEGDCDVVIGPARDGGYYLVGLKREQEALFKDMAWGTAGVLETTRRRIKENHLKYFELPARMDIDRPEDLKELEKRSEG